ncbi:MAG: family Cu/Zn efflux transporter [Geminicoccaceae bacterium]|nr:family Cu/Zn efflux transporter [Geminicoccaceae bacterium]
MIDFLLQVAFQIWWILKEASVFLLFGFALAGVLAVTVPARTLMRFFGTGKVKSVLWASAIGAPLPLCSCGVLPTALGLRRQGATKGATVSFLIATPETGVDSISLTYALMDPIMTIFRPVTAVTTAITAGLTVNFFGSREPARANGEAQLPDAGRAADACCDAGHAHDGHAHHYGHPHQPDASGADEAAVGKPRAGLSRTVRDIYGYAFRDLLDEIAYWLVLGIALSGVIAAALPPDLIERYLDDPFVSMLVMLVIGIPLYTCASAATPVMATLVLKGLNPGAALVFLLAGPATSLGSITVLLKFLGARVVALYLASIAVVALLAGFAVNWTYQALAIDPRAIFGTGTTFIPEPLKVGGGLLLLALLLVSLRRTHVPGEWLWLRDRFAGLSGIGLTARRLQVGALAALALLYLGSGLFTVQPGEIGLRQRFGAITAADLGPGLHYRLPWPFGSHRIVATDLVRRAELGFRSAAADLGARALARDRLTVGGPGNPVPNAIKATGFWFEKQSVPEESFLLTGDGNFIDIRFSLQYRVVDPVAFAYGIAEPEALVRSLTLAALRSLVGTSGIDAVYTTERGATEQRVAGRVQDLLDRYGAGIELMSVRLLYVHPPTEVHDAFRDVASAQEDKLRTINRAQTFAVEDVNQAQGEAAALIEEALAFQDERIRRVLPGVQKFVRPGADDVKEFDLWLLEPFGGGKP